MHSFPGLSLGEEGTVVGNVAFSKREQSFCVLEYARTSSALTVQ